MRTTGLQRYKKRQGRHRGTALVMMFAGMVALLGCCAMVIDYGALVADANKLQKACDAAALAAASQLEGGFSGNSTQERQRAHELAIKTAQENGVTLRVNGNSGTSPDVNFDSNGRPTQVTVLASTTQGFFFGKIMGYPEGRVTRQATAGKVSCNTPVSPRVVPLGITNTTYEAYKRDGITNIGNPNPRFQDIVLVRANKSAFVKDDVVAFDMRGPNSKSPQKFMEQLQGLDTGYPPPTVDPPAYETTLNASLNKQGDVFEDAFSYLFQKAAGPPWNDSPIVDTAAPYTTEGRRYSDILNGNSPVDAQGNANPRIMNLIITPPNDTFVVGTNNLQVLGYAPVYVQRVYEAIDPQDGSTDVHMVIGFLPPVTTSSEACGNAGGGSFTGNQAVVLIG